MNLSSIAKSAGAHGMYQASKASKHVDNAVRIKESPQMKEAILHNDPFPKLSAFVAATKSELYLAVSKLAERFSGK